MKLFSVTFALIIFIFHLTNKKNIFSVYFCYLSSTKQNIIYDILSSKNNENTPYYTMFYNSILISYFFFRVSPNNIVLYIPCMYYVNTSTFNYILIGYRRKVQKRSTEPQIENQVNLCRLYDLYGINKSILTRSGRVGRNFSKSNHIRQLIFYNLLFRCFR